MKKHLLLFIFCGFYHLAYTQSRITEKYTPPKDAINIPLSNGKIKLKVGQTAYLSYIVHGSVGIWGDVKIADTTTINSVDTHLAFERVHQEGATGDDKATRTVVLKGLKAGRTIITYQKVFRGRIERTHRIKINVQK